MIINPLRTQIFVTIRLYIMLSVLLQYENNVRYCGRSENLSLKMKICGLATNRVLRTINIFNLSIQPRHYGWKRDGKK